MDENNTMNENETQSTTNTYEQVNDTTTQPEAVKSAFSMEPVPTSGGDTAQNATSYYTSSDNTSANNYTYNSTVSEEPSTGFAIASLILGILSIPTSCCCGLGILFGILGIIFGCLQQKDNYNQKPGMAIAGIITSIIGILLSIIAIIYYAVVGSFASHM